MIKFLEKYFAQSVRFFNALAVIAIYEMFSRLFILHFKYNICSKINAKFQLNKELFFPKIIIFLLNRKCIG